MAYTKLTPAQEEQIVKMDRDGSPADEIIAFFRTTYQITIDKKKISNIKQKMKAKAEAAAAEFRGGGSTKSNKKKYAKRITKKQSVVADDEPVDVAELAVLLQEIDAGYKKLLSHFKDTLKNLRAELMKSKAQVNDMLTGAGIKEE